MCTLVHAFHNLGADFWEVDEDSNFSVFRVQRFTERPRPLHLGLVTEPRLSTKTGRV